MNQFYLTTTDNKAASPSANNTPTPEYRIEAEKRYSARLEMLGNQLSQVKVTAGGSKPNITIPLPAQQLPSTISGGQNYQVSFSQNNQGQTQINFFSANSSAANPANPAMAKTISISLNDAQLVSLLSLNKAFKTLPSAAQQPQLQTQAQVLTNPNGTTIKLPGMNQAMALPSGLAELVKGKTELNTIVTVKDGKANLTLVLNQSASGKFTVPLSSEKLSQMVKQTLAQSPNLHAVHSPNGNAKTSQTLLQTSQTGKTTALILPNKTAINLATGLSNDSQVKIQNLNQRQLSILVTPAVTGQAADTKPLAAILLNRTLVFAPDVVTNKPANASDSGQKALSPNDQKALGPNDQKALGAKDQPGQAAAKEGKSTNHLNSHLNHLLSKAAASLKPMLDSLNNNSKAPATNTPTNTPANTATSQATASQTTAPTTTLQVDIEPSPDGDVAPNPIDTEAEQLNKALLNQQQKQVLDKLVEPLIRLLLPKKINWSEGLKTLQTLAQQLPDPPASTNLDSDQPQDEPQLPQLKQLLQQIGQSVPDHTKPLTEKNIAEMVSQLLNFNPTRVPSSPLTINTPANAIASAIQLLLGSKLVQQSEQKITPQALRQLTSLLKPLTEKQPSSNAGFKALTSAMAQTEQNTGSLKTLSGIQSGIQQQQLDNAEKKLDGSSQLNLTMPLKLDDDYRELHISINEEPEKNGKSSQKKSSWQLNLTFDLHDLGKLMVNAKLTDGEVNMHLYAEQQRTLTLMEKFSTILEQRLESQGVKVVQLASSLGKIPTTESGRPITSLLQVIV